VLSLALPVDIYLCVEPTDMRKSFDGLWAVAVEYLGRDPLAGGLFVFINKRRDRMKLLYWDADGIAVWAKKLETEDSQIFGFTEVGRRAHNQHAGAAEAGRMVGIPRKYDPRRCVMPRQGSLSVPPRALRQRGVFHSTNSGRC
jgi:hypothetical protein